RRDHFDFVDLQLKGEHRKGGMDVTSAGVRGVRGTITARANTTEAIGEAAKEQVRRMMDENGIGPEDIASIIFAVTDDLNAAFPAEAAREQGLHMVPLL